MGDTNTTHTTDTMDQGTTNTTDQGTTNTTHTKDQGYFVANRPEHPFRLIFTLDTQHLLGMNGHDDGRRMMQAFNVDMAETDPGTRKIWMYLKNESDLQNASQWVRDNKSLHIEEHIERQCAHPYCSGLREQAEKTTRLEVDEAAALAASRGEQPPQRLEDQGGAVGGGGVAAASAADPTTNAASAADTGNADDLMLPASVPLPQESVEAVEVGDGGESKEGNAGAGSERTFSTDKKAAVMLDDAAAASSFAAMHAAARPAGNNKGSLNTTVDASTATSGESKMAEKGGERNDLGEGVKVGAVGVSMDAALTGLAQKPEVEGGAMNGTGEHVEKAGAEEEGDALGPASTDGILISFE